MHEPVVPLAPAPSSSVRAMAEYFVLDLGDGHVSSDIRGKALKHLQEQLGADIEDLEWRALNQPAGVFVFAASPKSTEALKKLLASRGKEVKGTSMMILEGSGKGGRNGALWIASGSQNDATATAVNERTGLTSNSASQENVSAMKSVTTPVPVRSVGGQHQVDVVLKRLADPSEAILATAADVWAHLWGSTAVLASIVAELGQSSTKLRVLELGAGYGMPSIVMGKFGHRVYCTDGVPAAAKMIEDNLALNKVQATCSAGVLNWNAPSFPTEQEPPFDLVLGADVGYLRRDLGPILKALSATVGPKGAAILVEPGRPSGMDLIGMLEGQDEWLWSVVIGKNIQTPITKRMPLVRAFLLTRQEASPLPHGLQETITKWMVDNAVPAEE